MSVAAPTTSRLLARVYGVALGAPAAVALVVAVTGAGEVREALHWSFPGVPATLASAASIFANNATKIVVAAAASAIVQAPWIGVTSAEIRVGRAWRVRRALCDAVCLYTVAQNIAILGAGLGAYGGRMLLAVLPHGPIELLAFAFAAVLYLRARSGPIAARTALVLLASSVLTLAVAALVEAFISV